MSVQDSESALRALYAELARQVADAPRAGAPYRRTRDGISYLYAKLPAGRGRVDRFLGRAEEPSTLAKAIELRRGTGLARERRRLVAALRAAGLPAPGRALGATLQALAFAGLFDGGAVLVGEVAYLVSNATLGRALPVSKGDPLDALDLALSAATVQGESVEAVLRRAAPDFAAVLLAEPPRGAEPRSGEGYQLTGAIRPRRGAGALSKPPPEAEADPAPPEQLDWLIAHPVRAVALWGAGVPVTIPRPARLAVHKLLVAGRRPEEEARAAELAQAAALLEALRESDPAALDDALADARGRGWSGPIDSALARLPRACALQAKGG